MGKVIYSEGKAKKAKGGVTKEEHAQRKNGSCQRITLNLMPAAKCHENEEAPLNEVEEGSLPTKRLEWKTALQHSSTGKD